MINLSSLSALIRTLRHSTGIDGPAAPVARVASVTPVADDDAGAMNSTALRPSLWAHTQLLPLDALEAEGSPQHAEARRMAPQPHPRALEATAATHSPSRPAMPAVSHSTALDLTATARILQAVLRGTGLKTPVAPTITSTAPLVPNPQAPVAAMARGLANAVAESGLFYESHLARSLRREYPVAALSREPQALWPATAVAEGLLAHSATPASLTDAASAMLTRQLDLLDTRTVLWNGDVWPGQRATIAFEEGLRNNDEAANDAEVSEPTASWRTRITLDLPSLGRVHATLNLHDGALDLALQASDPDAVTRLDSARQALETVLGDAQVAVHRFDVGPAPKA